MNRFIILIALFISDLMGGIIYAKLDSSREPKEKTWLCISDDSTGFHKDGNKWVSGYFGKDKKYLFKKKRNLWIFSIIGTKINIAVCFTNHFSVNGSINCFDDPFYLSFSSKTMK